MAVPTWVSGQVLTASDVNTWFVPQSVLKTSNQSVTSSTTLVNDTQLVLPVTTNAIYEMTCHLIYDGDAAGDIKVSWVGPASATMDWVSLALGGGAASTTDTTSHTAQTIGTSGQIGALGAGTSLVAPCHGILTTLGTAGNLQLQWAQFASSAVATRVLTGSTLLLRRIG